MAWIETRKEITKDEYEALNRNEKKLDDFFSEAQIVGYGAIPGQPYEKDGKYYIPYGISTSCD